MDVAGAVAAQVSILHAENKNVLQHFSLDWKSDIAGEWKN
jgi:hypothetical protein